MYLLLITLSALAPYAAPDVVPLTSPFSQVRALGSEVAAALADGLRRSPTFARLIAALNRSDVIVYVEMVHTLPPTTSGRMVLTTRDSRFRYVRIQVASRLFPAELISVIGHELQHAVEVATQPYSRPDRTATMAEDDTAAAVRVGAQVRRELDRFGRSLSGGRARQP
jgi:hypothetical protein